MPPCSRRRPLESHKLRKKPTSVFANWGGDAEGGKKWGGRERREARRQGKPIPAVAKLGVEQERERKRGKRPKWGMKKRHQPDDDENRAWTKR